MSPTPPWRAPAEGGGTGRPGFVSLLAILACVVLSTIGLGLALLTSTYGRWSAYRGDIVLLEAAAGNGARAAFAALAAASAARSSPILLTEERYAGLREATLSGRIEAIESILDRTFPWTFEGLSGSATWSASISVRTDRIADAGSFFTARFRGDILARGQSVIAPTRSRSIGLGAVLTAAAGRVPLASFPFLLAGEGAPESTDELAASGSLVIESAGDNAPPLPPAASSLPLVPRDAAPLLAETLKIKIFSPDRISLADLRRALGLPLVDEPVPAGAYLIANDAGLGGVFVQGDVEEMVLAAGDGRQHVQIRQAAGTWRLRFQPSEFLTEFEGPDDLRVYERLPLPIVLVAGSIASLGGGTIGPDNGLTLSDRTDVPALLDGVSLTIVSTDEIVLTSHLIREGVRWQDGIPYLKDPRRQLILYASGADPLGGTETAGRIRIAADAPAGLQIHADLAAAGEVRIESPAGEVTIAGGIQASSLDPGRSRVRIVPGAAAPPDDEEAAPAPRTASPVLCLLGLEAIRWIDNPDRADSL